MSREFHPRIYVASLADYNAGRLHGVWIVLSDGLDACWRAVQAMLDASPEPVAEEWAIHDYEDFGPVRLHEYENLETVVQLAQGIVRHGEAFAAFADHLGSSEWDDLDRFEDCYLGSYPDLRAFADHFLETIGIELDPSQWAPREIAAYVEINVDRLARDLQYDFIVLDGNEGIHVFEAC